MKVEVLGTVGHIYWKKGYEARGAPHYHGLLWIKDAPVIGQDDPDEVLEWIQDRITCHIPKKETDPELYTIWLLDIRCTNVVATANIGGSVVVCFITMCRFGFPQQPCENMPN